MAQKELALYVAEQLAPLGEIRYIPMMGGWLFYYREKLIGGIYGDGFAVKDTAASRRFMPDCREEVWADTPPSLLPLSPLPLSLPPPHPITPTAITADTSKAKIFFLFIFVPPFF